MSAVFKTFCWVGSILKKDTALKKFPFPLFFSRHYFLASTSFPAYKKIPTFLPSAVINPLVEEKKKVKEIIFNAT